MRTLLCLPIAVWSIAHAASPNMELAKSVFDPRVMSNAVESPVPGLYQFAQGAEVFYISADGRYVMQGEMVDLQTQNNVTESFRASERVKALAQLDPASMISVSPNAPQYQITVFIDVDCPYCRVMQQNILEYTQRGIAIRYLAFPRSGSESIAALRLSQVWCSPNRLTALLLAETDQPLPNSRGDCSSIIRDHFTTGLQMGINSTPSVILEDGTLIPGFVAPANLEVMLNQHLRHNNELIAATSAPDLHGSVHLPPDFEPPVPPDMPLLALSMMQAVIHVQNSDARQRASLEVQAEQGVATAQYHLGQLYADGKGGEKNLEKARKWFEKAAAQGNAEAAFRLGRLYDSGDSVAQDSNKARQYYSIALKQWQKTAEAGDAEAQYKLAILLSSDEAENTAAQQWFAKAAAQGHAEAAFKLARIYDEGIGMDKNPAQARQFYQQALAQWQKNAAAGDSDAQYQLGLMYREGLGVSADAAKARIWFEKAAAQGNEAAQAALK